MGRPRKPTRLKILDNDRADRINLSEPASPPGVGDPPSWLDPQSIAAWTRLKALIEPMGIAKNADREMLSLYCVTFSTWSKALARVEDEGLTIKTDTTEKAHPCLGIAYEAQRQMTRILCRFGLSPSDRAGLHVEERPKDDLLIQFIASRNQGKPTDGKRRSKAH